MRQGEGQGRAENGGEHVTVLLRLELGGDSGVTMRDCAFAVTTFGDDPPDVKQGALEAGVLSGAFFALRTAGEDIHTTRISPLRVAGAVSGPWYGHGAALAATQAVYNALNLGQWSGDASDGFGWQLTRESKDG